MKAPLSGVTVLSLAERYPGPLTTMILADLGADVILVERPGGGDPTRQFPGHFEALGRNKRSVAIDLKSEPGREAFLALAANADVVVEGFRPGVLERLGISMPSLRERFPRLVCASISSYGQTGPLRQDGGHDLTIQAAAGFVKPGPDGRPAPAPLPLADLSSALYAAIGIVTALFVRGEGEGSYVDVSMLDCVVSLHSTMLVSALNGLGIAPYPPDDPGYNVFVAADGSFVALSIAGEDHQWQALCAELQLERHAHLSERERERRAAELDRELAAAISTRQGQELIDRCNERGIGAGPVVADLAEVADNPQVRARGQLVRAGGPHGPLVVRQPLLFDGEGSEVDRGSPRVGQHTREVLSEVGMEAGEIESLLETDAAFESSIQS
jgi:crotonobetainyl-CoA:carnitine CoA-transferase CaiB-like acyl-CoA transferase